MTCVSCVAQGLHLHRLCIASDRVGRESATATASATANTKAKEQEDKFEADRHHKKSLCHPPESPDVDKSSAEFRWRLDGGKGVENSWKPVVMLRCLEFAGQ